LRGTIAFGVAVYHRVPAVPSALCGMRVPASAVRADLAIRFGPIGLENGKEETIETISSITNVNRFQRTIQTMDRQK